MSQVCNTLKCFYSGDKTLPEGVKIYYPPPVTNNNNDFEVLIFFQTKISKVTDHPTDKKVEVWHPQCINQSADDRLKNKPLRRSKIDKLKKLKITSTIVELVPIIFLAY